MATCAQNMSKDTLWQNYVTILLCVCWDWWHIHLIYVRNLDRYTSTCYTWRIRDQLDVTSYYALFHSFYAQHVSDINTSIIRSLRLFYCITTLVVCSCFDVCWSCGVVGLGWYPCSRLRCVGVLVWLGWGGIRVAGWGVLEFWCGWVGVVSV